MLCVWGPPSDQPRYSYTVPLLACGAGALTESVEPTIAVRVNGVVWLVDPTARVSPAGIDANVRSTVCGSSRTVVVLVKPPESVAVNRRSRCDGYSWSGATKLPLAVPL